MAKVLNVKASYFITDPICQISWLEFRKQSGLTKTIEEEIKAIGQSIAEKHISLMDKICPDEEPSFPAGSKIRTMDDAETASEQVRSYWKLGDAPLVSLTDILEENGGIIAGYDKMGTVRFDGLSGTVNDKFPLMIINSHPSIPVDRKRFDLGHELGHVVLDCTNKDNCEKLMHRFAGAFLAPRSVVYKTFGRQRHRIYPEELAVFKEKYGISMAALLYRARDLNIISDSYYTNMNIQFRQRGLHKNEGVEFKGKEQPSRLRQMVLRALAEDVITVDEAERLCNGIVPKLIVDQTIRLTPKVMMKLSVADRKKLLASVAKIAEKVYGENSELTEFEAFGGHDLEN
jgi:Zn-dependent peptidase ImmA (M78 family)